jgi:hypothetical protein
MEKHIIMDDKFNKMVERIAILEQQAEHGQRDRDEMKVTLEVIHQSQNDLVNKISKWEGKFGGVIFAASCLWIFLTGLPQAVVEWFKMRGG